MRQETIEFTDMQMDALREIASIGAGHAATALSKMIGREVMIRVPDVSIVRLEEAPNVVSNDEEEVVDGVYFRLTGELLASSLVMFPSKSGRFLVDTILGKEIGSSKPITEDMERSALIESGNIIAGCYLTALGSITGLVVTQSIPYFASGTAGAIFNSMLAETGLTSQMALIIEIEFIEASKILRGWIYIVPDITSSSKILDTLGVK